MKRQRIVRASAQGGASRRTPVPVVAWGPRSQQTRTTGLLKRSRTYSRDLRYRQNTRIRAIPRQRDPQMEDAANGPAMEIEGLLRAMATTSMPEDHTALSAEARQRENAQIQTRLQEIRAMSGLERFMSGSTYKTLREAARDHPVVMLVADRNQAVAMIMPNPSHPSPDILQLDVANDTLQTVDITHRGLLAELWLSVVKPVLAHLGLAKQENPSRRPRLHWCTAGDFAFLPVHAAGIYAGADQECCSDYVVSSYTPTLSGLLHARRNLQPFPTAEAKLLLVAAEHATTPQLAALASVQAEMSVIIEIADRAGVQYAVPSRIVSTPEMATAALQSATLVHIASHGLQDVLSMSDLMKLHLWNAFIAFLSACDTAKGNRDQPDQAIHLASKMLFIGFRSIVATMWAMRDEDGPVVSKAFYEKLFEADTIAADAIPYALDHAVRKLRESGALVERWATFIHVGA